MLTNRYFPDSCDETAKDPQKQRGLSDLLVSRSAALPESEAGWIKAVYELQQPAASLAATLRLNPRSFRARLKRIVDRLLSPEYVFVWRNRSRWPVRRREIATAMFIEGKSERQAAALLRVPYHEVRRERKVILAMLESSRTRPVHPFPLMLRHAPEKEAA